jgi:hypothetical protein
MEISDAAGKVGHLRIGVGIIVLLGRSSLLVLRALRVGVGFLGGGLVLLGLPAAAAAVRLPRFGFVSSVGKVGGWSRVGGGVHLGGGHGFAAAAAVW